MPMTARAVSGQAGLRRTGEGHGRRRGRGAAQEQGLLQLGCGAHIPDHRTPGGAAGGIGFAAMLLGARTVSGADYFLDLFDFDRLVADADLVISGEGRLDEQTLQGKLPSAVALRAVPTPVVAVVGRNDLGDATAGSGFADIFAVADLTDGDTSEDPHRTAELLHPIGTQIGTRYAALL